MACAYGEESKGRTQNFRCDDAANEAEFTALLVDSVFRSE